MSEDTLKNLIRKTIRETTGVISYAYQGGEPTLRGLDFYKSAVKYQKEYNNAGIKIMNAFQTNGALIDEKWCSFFKENDFLVGISLDGNKFTHDRYRHLKESVESSFDRTMSAIKLLEEHGVRYNVLTVVSREVATDIETIYDFYKKLGIEYQQYIPCLDPIDEVRGTKSYSLTPIEYGEFLIKLFGKWLKDYRRNKDPYIRQFDNYRGILMGYEPEACDQRGRCMEYYVCEADGSVYPCDFYMLDRYRLGNINEDTISVLDKKRIEIGFTKESEKLDKTCHECKYYRLCRGGCQRNRIMQDTGLYKNYYCESYKMFFDRYIDYLK